MENDEQKPLEKGASPAATSPAATSPAATPCTTTPRAATPRGAAPRDPYVRAENEDDDGYDPYSDRRPEPEPLFERDPWG